MYAYAAVPVDFPAYPTVWVFSWDGKIHEGSAKLTSAAEPKQVAEWARLQVAAARAATVAG